MLENILEVISSKQWLAHMAAALALVLLLIWVMRSRRGKARFHRYLKGVSVDMLSDVLIPNGMGGEIHLDRLLLTAKGLVVVDLKEVEGTVFGSDRMDDWTVITDDRRFTFPNPQPALYDRVAAVKSLVSEVPVNGHVLFSERADFSKGRPKHVVHPKELLDRYRKPARSELLSKTDAFRPHWEQLRRAAVAVSRHSLGNL